MLDIKYIKECPEEVIARLAKKGKDAKEDIEAILPQVNEYLDSEDLILTGDLYRIDNPNTSNYFSYMLVAKDKSRATLTAYKSLGRVEDEIKRIRPTGLDPNSNYFIRELNITLNGKTIMNAGITLNFNVNGKATDFKAIKFHFNKV